MKVIFINLIHNLLLGLILIALINCSSSYNSGLINKVNTEEINKKIKGEAYLFDVKLKRDGKPTSFRLEIYQTDSIVAFSGRGYLGKGALKGRIDDDSILIYFPASNEFLYEPTPVLLDFKECNNDLRNFNFLDLLNNFPEERSMNSNIIVSSNLKKIKTPQFTLYNPNCSWKIDIKYDKRKTGWRMKSFFVNDGAGNTIKSVRRTYKKKAKIPYKRFIINIPDDAYRIIP